MLLTTHLHKFVLFLGSMFVASTMMVAADVVAYWNFNNIPAIAAANTPGNGGVPTSITPTSGSGTLSLSGYTGAVDDFAWQHHQCHRHPMRPALH
jgi:hypothetical protein